MPYADGIETYVKHGDVIMPFGYHKCPLDFQRLLFANYAKIFPSVLSANVTFQDTAINGEWGYRHYENSENNQDVRKLILYFHGGGFVLGGYDSHHDIAAEICDKTKHDVWLINYPLAPESRFPEPLEFCKKIQQIATASPSYSDIMLAGDSSGGNLAVNIAMEMESTGHKKASKVSLFSPVLNFARWSQGGEDSPRLSGDEMEHFVNCYTGGKVAPGRVEISPILHTNTFVTFPPTIIISAGEDSLKEDAYLLEERLNSNGNKVEHICVDGLVHGCIRAKSISNAASNAFHRFWEFLV